MDSREILTRPAPPPDRTVAYGPEPDHVADVWLPRPGGGPPGTRAGTEPLVILLHGGFWRAAYDRAHCAPLAVALAERGYPVACPEYRRVGGPGGGWPNTLRDVAEAVTAVPGLVAGGGGPDRGRPIVAGHSAGGHLALWVAGEVQVRGVLALAPVADLVRGYRLDLGSGAVGELLGGDPEGVPDRYRSADPMARVPVPAPTVVVHGTADDGVPVAFGRDYVTAARAAGGDARFVPVTGADHFALIDPRSPAWPALLDALSSISAGRGGGPG